MVQIRIQREWHSMWIWVVAVLIVLASVAWLAFGPSNDADEGSRPMFTTMPTSGALAPATRSPAMPATPAT